MPAATRNALQRVVDGMNPDTENENDIGMIKGHTPLRSPRKRTTIDRLKRKLIAHAKFVGPGVIASVAYIDPGNWATDLQAGSQFGYSHLFIILLSGLIALLFQVLATRLGCVSDLDLSQNCRRALYDRPKHKMVYRWGVLYPLYALSEIGIIFTDLAELLGSAIAINLIIPAIPLWGAVLITSLDVFLILLLFDQYPTRMITRSMRMFELLIGLLVMTVLGSFVALLVKVSPVWKDVFHGYVPGPGIIRGGGLYVAVGIVGATVMPHAFFIGSKMATMRRLAPDQYAYDDDDEDLMDEKNTAAVRMRDVSTMPNPARRPSHGGGPHLHLPQPVALGNFNIHSNRNRAITSTSASTAADMIVETGSTSPAENSGDAASKKTDDGKNPAPLSDHPKPTLACVRAHLGHAVADVAGSLLGFAILINSSILILAAAVFYYGKGRSSVGNEGVSDLFDAFDLVKQYLGQVFAYLFAIGLFMAGQSASLTVTLSGQIISEGFIEWHTTPWKRRLVTRLIGIVPSLAVAVAIGREGISVLLVGSQVALSIVLTFVLVPLIIFTSQSHIMSIPITSPGESSAPISTPDSFPQASATPLLVESPIFIRRSLKEIFRILNPVRKRAAPEGHVSFVNSALIVYLCWALWLLITIANVLALYDIGAST
ncbi:BQ5605_C004g02859 [Microbotryum silenes-dioicae]|uniref:BQ5605_C004g02859 protein n=1 Tax=Microbotryum silenes-dioicae TaxID=796604 RepID=A0A2X0MCB1_9BASI|nr:BQ5605_C004g02859 [Microbotryum silenes-dioicae]